VSQYALTASIIATLLVACGGSQPPIGAPGAVLQSSRVLPSPSYKVLHRFSLAARRGARPYGALIDVNGTLYGTTYGFGGQALGTVYSISPSGEKRALYRFHGPDGEYPQGTLLNIHGTLYGTTTYGGATNDGVVFSVTASGVETVLYSFKGGSDGANPYAGLINVNGTLYGTTYAGGDSACYSGRGCGSVYSMTTTGTETVLHRFSGGRSDGEAPYASLVDFNGSLYGTTYSGGASGQGVVYTITTSGIETVHYNFEGGSDGAYPKSSLIAVRGMLYGTTYYGGGRSNCRADPGCGTVFSIKPSGEERVLYSFGGESDGSNPIAPLVDVKGTLYGTTFTGGTRGSKPCGYLDLGCGTVYSINDSGSETVLHSFKSGHDGAFPYAGLVSAGSTLYGTTSLGGGSSECNLGPGYGCGTVFALTP
jgi:uncharacterized repeat protein (TIGR03803 family)